MPITIEKINDTCGFSDLKNNWNRLLEDSPLQSVFLTWEWLFTWWEHFGTDKKLYILLARDSNEIVGIAPLMMVNTKRKGLHFKMLCSLGAPDIDVAGFIIKTGYAGILADFCKEIWRASGEWDVFEFGEFPNDVFNPQDLVSYFPEKSCRFRVMPRRHAFIPTDGDWDPYYKSLAKRHRRGMRKREKLLGGADKTVTYRRFNNGAAGPEHFDVIFDINARARFPDLYATEELKNFHRALAKPEMLQQAVDISLLLVEDVPVAFEYGFLFNRVYEAWRGAYHLDFAKFSPGSLIFLKLLQDSFQSGHLGVDLLRGEHEYKRHWRGHDHAYTLLRIVPHRNVLACALYVWIPLLKKWVLSRLRRS